MICARKGIRRWSFTLLAAGIALAPALRGAAQSPAFLVEDINTRPGTADSSPSQFVEIGATTFFVADNPVTGYELWKTDGTDAGTVLVKDIHPGVTGSDPWYLTEVGGRLFFTASDGTHG
jgi:ELWxxDGT repeat protein